jgi:hypothetical protein
VPCTADLARNLYDQLSFSFIAKSDVGIDPNQLLL